MTAKLSKELRKTGKKRISVRKGDTVKIMRGKHKKKEGKISKCFPKTGKVTIEGINTKKTSGTEIPVKIEVSNLMVIALNKKDKKRFKESNTKKGDWKNG